MSNYKIIYELISPTGGILRTSPFMVKSLLVIVDYMVKQKGVQDAFLPFYQIRD